MELGCHSWTNCLAVELFSTLGSPSTIFVTLFRTTVGRASCKSTQFASYWRCPYHLNVYCSGGGGPYVISVDLEPKQTNKHQWLVAAESRAVGTGRCGTGLSRSELYVLLLQVVLNSCFSGHCLDDTSFMCSFNRGNTEGTNSSKIWAWCLCMYVLRHVCVGICFVDWFDWQRVHVWEEFYRRVHLPVTRVW